MSALHISKHRLHTAHIQAGLLRRYTHKKSELNAHSEVNGMKGHVLSSDKSYDDWMECFGLSKSISDDCSKFSSSNGDVDDGGGHRIWRCLLAAAGPCTIPEDADSKKGNLKTSSTLQQSEYNIESSSCSPSSSYTGETSNHEHFGKDLSGFLKHSSKSYGLISDFHSLNTLKTPTSGSKKLFIIELSNTLTEISIKKRYQIGFKGPIAFIESSHLCKFAQCAHGSVAVYHLRSTKKLWKLGIISGIFPLNDPPVVDMFEWTGDLEKNEILQNVEFSSF